jgi:hypothetical protein
MSRFLLLIEDTRWDDLPAQERASMIEAEIRCGGNLDFNAANLVAVDGVEAGFSLGDLIAQAVAEEKREREQALARLQAELQAAKERLSRITGDVLKAGEAKARKVAKQFVEKPLREAHSAARDALTMTREAVALAKAALSLAAETIVEAKAKGLDVAPYEARLKALKPA